ncbi:tetratricopeptide repeat protein [Bacillus smithii]|uniref:tetratricopeptide repeat protein n=1 Tax=Bacillus smithii TaxID=1479 RepID=UPI003D208843
MDLESYFMKGHNLLLKHQYDEAMAIFSNIVKRKRVTQYHSGSYVNMARCLIEQAINEEREERILNDEKKSLIKKYLDNALHYKPNNQAALGMYFLFYFTYKEYAEAIRYFLEIRNEEVVDHYMKYLLLLRNEKDEKLIRELEKVYKKYPKYRDLGTVIGIMFMRIGDAANAYYYFRQVKESSKYNLDVLINLGLVCNILKNPSEAEKYCTEALEISKKLLKKSSDKNAKKIMQDLQQKALTNLCLSYLFQHKYKEAEQLLVSKLKRNPNNADYHNLAFAHYKMGNYNKSITNCEKALYISEDELGFFLMAENKFAKGEYENSIEWYRKTIMFLENSPTSFSFEDLNQKVISDLFNKEEMFQRAYIAIIQAYIECRELITAKAYFDIAIKKWPYNDELFKLNKILNSLISLEDENDQIKRKIESIKHEWNENEKVLKSKVNQVKEWAIALLRLQNRCEDYLNFDSEEDWKVIERQMHEIAEKMFETENNNINYVDIKNKLKKLYPKLNEKSLTFLSTGEFLLNTHTNDFIDYAPIMIEYCKVVEIELNEVLKMRKILNKKREYTLGQILVELEKKNTMEWLSFTPVLREIIVLRNGSAHTGKSTRDKVINLRSYLLDEKWLDFILNWKDPSLKK